MKYKRGITGSLVLGALGATCIFFGIGISRKLTLIGGGMLAAATVLEINSRRGRELH